MRDLTRSVYRFLQADTKLADLLGQYNGATAVFTSTPVPEDTASPFIVISGSTSDFDAGSKNSEMRMVTMQVAAYANQDGNIDSIEEIGDHLRDVLGHKIHTEAELNVRNWSSVNVQASGPIVHDVEDLYGRIVTVELLLHQQAN